MIFTWVQLVIATGENATDAAFSEMTSLPENVTTGTFFQNSS
jgi:hypothetical protein